MKFKNKKKKNKNLLLKILIFLVTASILGIGVYYFLTAEDEDSGLTLLEKQWIESNKSVLVDINIPNNIDIYAKEGSGVLFDFLNYISEDTELAFNKIPYSYPAEKLEGLSIAILKNSDTIGENDLLIFEDNYVILGKNNIYLSSIDEINGSTLGILDTDSKIIKDSFNYNNFTYKEYSSVSSAITDLDKQSIQYLVIPRYAFLEEITKDNIYINYTLENLSNKFVLKYGKTDKINIIMTKLLSNWLQKGYRESFESYLINFYSKKNSLTELDKSTLSNRVYKYGYVKDDAYNTLNNNKLYGVAGEYINTLKTMVNMEFEYVEYSNIEALKKDLDNERLDIAYLNFTYDNEDYIKSNSVLSERFAVLSKEYKNISNKTGLINSKLFVKKDDHLYNYLTNNINASVKIIKNYSTSIKDDGLLVIDENEYLALKNSLLSDYEYLFSDSFEGNYNFTVKKNNEILYNLLNFTLNMTNSNEYRSIAINNIYNSLNNQNDFKGLYMIVVAIILLPIFIVFLSIIIIKNTKKLNISKKENILKYNDLLTNLKNRNYLNDNIEKWDDTKIFPRTIVMIDLNNLKYVNDNYGHEEGNELIKKAAAILINTQLEKSDIIRTDGNEFLIYLIGYSKTQVSTYLSKLVKEFDKLPYGFGAAMGYSIITDEIKTIDDAINEATIEMRVDKEKNYR